jgi:uncharacterized Fe-S center protein
MDSKKDSQRGGTMAAEVYFVDMRARSGQNLLDKLGRLFDRAGFNELIEPLDLVALKLHFGERGNLAYIRPQYLRRLVDRVKARGGRPFLTDANTLYVGSRANAVDHLETAIENGFDYAVVGAPLIIADGLNGKDYISVDIGQRHFENVKIGSALYHADVLLAVTHFKGHEITGFWRGHQESGHGFRVAQRKTNDALRCAAQGKRGKVHWLREMCGMVPSPGDHCLRS